MTSFSSLQSEYVRVHHGLHGQVTKTADTCWKFGKCLDQAESFQIGSFLCSSAIVSWQRIHVERYCNYTSWFVSIHSVALWDYLICYVSKGDGYHFAGVPNSSLTMPSAVLQCHRSTIWALNAEDLHDSEDKVEALWQVHLQLSPIWRNFAPSWAYKITREIFAHFGNCTLPIIFAAATRPQLAVDCKTRSHISASQGCSHHFPSAGALQWVTPHEVSHLCILVWCWSCYLPCVCWTIK